MTYSTDRIDCYFQVAKNAQQKGLTLSHGQGGYIVRKGGILFDSTKLKDCAIFIRDYQP